ncbi:MAG: helix-turn-helix domain-containing protein [Lactobacillales bacterium]|jgi:cytoskeletal protein RodZ|nr:helix-turn-helix domain-containing protein [Lactobacillales bacterium]
MSEKSIGAILKEAREKKEYSIEQLAEVATISEDHIQLLEEDRAKEIRGAFYLRDLVKKYAAAVDLPEQETVDAVENFTLGKTVTIPLASNDLDSAIPSEEEEDDEKSDEPLSREEYREAVKEGGDIADELFPEDDLVSDDDIVEEKAKPKRNIPVVFIVSFSALAILVLSLYVVVKNQSFPNDFNAAKNMSIYSYQDPYDSTEDTEQKDSTPDSADSATPDSTPDSAEAPAPDGSHDQSKEITVTKNTESGNTIYLDAHGATAPYQLTLSGIGQASFVSVYADNGDGKINYGQAIMNRSVAADENYMLALPDGATKIVIGFKSPGTIKCLLNGFDIQETQNATYATIEISLLKDPAPAQ